VCISFCFLSAVVLPADSDSQLVSLVNDLLPRMVDLVCLVEMLEKLVLKCLRQLRYLDVMVDAFSFIF
jgi:hypothetical protein